jgi:polyadenylate-binding protein
VKQFPTPDFSDEDLKKIFSPFGEILSAVVMKNSEGNSLGFGFVCFKESESARCALEQFS